MIKSPTTSESVGGRRSPFGGSAALRSTSLFAKVTWFRVSRLVGVALCLDIVSHAFGFVGIIKGE